MNLLEPMQVPYTVTKATLRDSVPNKILLYNDPCCGHWLPTKGLQHNTVPYHYIIIPCY